MIRSIAAAASSSSRVLRNGAQNNNVATTCRRGMQESPVSRPFMHKESSTLLPFTRTSTTTRHFSVIPPRCSANSSSTSNSQLLPSQIPLVLPQLAPRMTQGRIVEWLVKEGDPIKPLQVFLLVETNELTEDGSPYLLEIESHETGLLRKKLVGDNSHTMKVGTPIAVFEDSEWEEGDAPRKGDFLWQAYVKEGTLRSGSCTPVRKDESPSEPAENFSTTAADSTSNSDATAAAAATATTKPKRGRKPKAATGAAPPDASSKNADATPTSSDAPTPTRKRTIKKKSE